MERGRRRQLRSFGFDSRILEPGLESVSRKGSMPIRPATHHRRTVSRIRVAERVSASPASGKAGNRIPEYKAISWQGDEPVGSFTRSATMRLPACVRSLSCRMASPWKPPT